MRCATGLGAGTGPRRRRADGADRDRVCAGAGRRRRCWGKGGLGRGPASAPAIRGGERRRVRAEDSGDGGAPAAAQTQAENLSTGPRRTPAAPDAAPAAQAPLSPSEKAEEEKQLRALQSDGNPYDRRPDETVEAWHARLTAGVNEANRLAATDLRGRDQTASQRQRGDRTGDSGFCEGRARLRAGRRAGFLLRSGQIRCDRGSGEREHPSGRNQHAGSPHPIRHRELEDGRHRRRRRRQALRCEPHRRRRDAGAHRSFISPIGC